jgi:hypothetical protein
MLNFRDVARNKSPRWLTGYWGERFIYSLIVQLDAIGDGLIDGVKARLPGFNVDALPLLARDRRLLRGPSESDDSFALRLRGWLDAHRRTGSPVALLSQLRAYLLPESPNVTIDLIANSGQKFSINTAGVISFASGSWDWDSHPELWSRFWIVIHASKWSTGSTWGSWTWGDGRAWGTNATPDEVAGVQSIVSEWTPPHARCVNVIVVTDETTWNAGTPPAGNWDRFANRSLGAAYWDGT